MPKQMSCSVVIGKAIRKFGLPAVQAAVEMAVELQRTDTVAANKKTVKHKVVAPPVPVPDRVAVASS